MADGAGAVLALIGESFRNPQAGMRKVLAVAPGTPLMWQVLALVVVVSVGLTELQSLLFVGDAALFEQFLRSPFLLAAIEGGLLVVMVCATWQIGRAFGGGGDLRGALAVVVWLQIIMICLQLVQTALTLVSPLLGALVGLFGLVAFFWLFVNFVVVLHGFTSLGLVFLATVLSTLGLGVILTLLTGFVAVFIGSA